MKCLKNYLLRNTPSLLLPLGAGFVMASSADVRAALGMGVAVIIVTVLSSIVISALKNFIPEKFHIPAHILVLTGFVSLVHMLMSALTPTVVDMLGVHLAALAVSAVPYREMEEVAYKNGEKQTIISSFVTGLFFLLIMVVCAVVREFLGNGSLFGYEFAFMANYKISALAGAFGGYLVLAIVLAVIRKIGDKVVLEEEVK